jgi:hypothetical protein
MGTDYATSSSRNIPFPLQREIRQRCGFGCVICGFPLYEYHHIERWTDVREHSADNITLLCNTHHRQAGSGLLPKSKIVRADKFPHNKRFGRSSDFPLYYEGDSINCIMGNNQFNFPKNDRVGLVLIVPLMIHGVSMLGFISEIGNLLLNLTLFDSSNKVVLRIVNNHLFYSISPWDIQFVGRTLTIREKLRKLLIKITFDPPDTVIIEEGRILHKNIEVLIDSKHLLVLSSGKVTADLQGVTGTARGNLAVGLLIGALPAELKNVGAGVCFGLPG